MKRITIQWLIKLLGAKKKLVYFGSEGMCGGHREVGLQIVAENFERFEKVIDLPLGWTTYLIKLKRKEINESAQFIKLTHFYGKVLNENNALVVSANLEISSANGKKFFTKSDSDGRFEIDLPIQKYTVKVSQNGFRSLKLINFNIEENKGIYLDFKLKVRGCDDCNGDILGENIGEDKQEVILDYQKIKDKY